MRISLYLALMSAISAVTLNPQIYSFHDMGIVDPDNNMFKKCNFAYEGWLMAFECSSFYIDDKFLPNLSSMNVLLVTDIHSLIDKHPGEHSFFYSFDDYDMAKANKSVLQTYGSSVNSGLHSPQTVSLKLKNDTASYFYTLTFKISDLKEFNDFVTEKSDEL